MAVNSAFETFVAAADAARYVACGYWSKTETIPSLLARNAAESPDRIALVDDAGRRLTYAELDVISSQVAAGLSGRGIERGDVVGVQLPNRVEASIVTCGIEKAGAVTCPMVPMYRDREVNYIVRKTSMKALFVPGIYRDYDHDALAASIARDVPALSTIVTLSETASQRPLLTLQSLLAEGSNRGGWVGPQLNPDDIAAVLFTSGTEADPKGVLHTHNTLLANSRSLARLLGLGEQDAIFMASPVGHGTGYGFGIRLAIFLGAKLVLLNSWNAISAARMISDEGCSYTHGATPFVQDLLEVPRLANEYDFSKLRYFVSGGATIPAGLWSRVKDVIGCQLLRLYGQTEGFMSTINRPNDRLTRLENTDGLRAPGVELHVVNDEGDPLPAGTPGEGVYKGPHRCVGFLNDPDRARRAMTPDGWLRTGDILTIDESGYVTVSGRRKEVINRGGYKYSPREVEDILVAHPDVLRAAVVKMSDPRLGEKACVYVVPRGSHKLDLPAITRFLKEQGVAPFKWPERLEIVDSLPMTASGKVQKYVLEARLAK